MATEVKCTISDCQFWAHGNYCAASAILITHGKPHPEIYLKAAQRFGLAPP